MAKKGGVLGGIVGALPVIGDVLGIASTAKGLFGGDEEMPIGPSQPSQAPEYTFLRSLLQPTPDPWGMGGQGVPMGVPGYQFGAFDQPGGPAMVGEGGPELAYLQPQTPVIPMPDFQPVEEPAASALPHEGFMASLAQALGHDPFSRGGSLGPVLEIALQAARGRQRRPNTGAQLGVAGLGAIANILSNRELVKQSDVEELNKSLRERSQARNKAMLEQQAEIAKEKRGEAKTIAAEERAANRAEGRKFQLSPTLATKLGLPSNARVTFTEYMSAVDKAKDELPKTEFDRILRASPAEWRTFVQRKGQVAAAEAAAKPKGVQELKPPSTTERERLSQDINTIRQTGRIRELFKPEFVGPVAGRRGAVETATGKGLAAGESKFRAALALYNNAAFKLLAGTAGSKAEADRVKKQLPSENDPSDVFLDKLEETDRRIREEAGNFRTTLTGTGVDLSQLEGLPASRGKAIEGDWFTQNAPKGR